MQLKHRTPWAVRAVPSSGRPDTPPPCTHTDTPRRSGVAACSPVPPERCASHRRGNPLSSEDAATRSTEQTSSAAPCTHQAPGAPAGVGGSGGGGRVRRPLRNGGQNLAAASPRPPALSQPVPATPSERRGGGIGEARLSCLRPSLCARNDPEPFGDPRLPRTSASPGQEGDHPARRKPAPTRPVAEVVSPPPGGRPPGGALGPARGSASAPRGSGDPLRAGPRRRRAPGGEGGGRRHGTRPGGSRSVRRTSRAGGRGGTRPWRPPAAPGGGGGDRPQAGGPAHLLLGRGAGDRAGRGTGAGGATGGAGEGAAAPEPPP